MSILSRMKREMATFIWVYLAPVWCLNAGLTKAVNGSANPPDFMRWLKELAGRKDIRVTFGHNRSFVAWTRNTMRWSGGKIPATLEEKLQQWSSSGRKLRGVSLGRGDSFFACTSMEVSYAQIPDIMKLALKHVRLDSIYVSTIMHRS